MAIPSKLIAITGSGLLVLYASLLVVEKIHASSALAEETDANAIPNVSVISPKKSLAKVALTLPGTIDAWYQAPIYAQVSGYVKMWYKDYGAHVKAGDVLAEINAPALDAQYAQAKADLASVMAKYRLATVTAERWRAMGKSQAVSGQSVSVSNANEESARAEFDAAQHNVDHFEALERFKTIVAPYDGVVTARNVSVGDYVNNGGASLDSTGGASELFTVADTHRLRLFVSVPEVFSYMLQPDLTASVAVPQYPDRTFNAQFLTTSHGFDPNTRTAITEFTMENDKQELWPGTFASVALKANNEHAHLYELPSSALVFEEHGMTVATVGGNNRVHYQKVVVGRMADSSTEVQAGVSPEDHVIDNPPADLLEGDLVHVITPQRGYNESGFGKEE